MFATIRKPRSRTLLLASAGCAAIGSVSGCSSNQTAQGNPTGVRSQTDPGGSGVGSIGLAFTLPGGDTIGSVTFALKDSNGNLVPLSVPNPGTVATNNSQSIDFQIGNVPAAAGDSITLSATTASGASCAGSAMGINITPRATQNVAVQLVCTAPGTDAGNLFVTGVASYCGTWTGLASGANGSEVYVGESVVLTTTATGGNPSNLGYTWTMSNPIGAFGAATGGVGATGQDEAVGPSDPMQFLCTAPGTTTIQVVVDDGPLPAGAGACPSNLTTVSTTVTCDAYPATQVEAAWVVIGSGNQAIARAITAAAPADAGANPCPAITINGGAPVQMNLRAAATTSLPVRTTIVTPSKPSLFPVSSCEYPLPTGATSAVVAGQSLPMPKANPTKVVVLGDTGCRLQVGNGFQSCNDPNPNGTDTPYPFAAIAALAAAQNPDLVLHVGDYEYRETECPGGAFNCAGSPWGYGWDSWEADLFAPGAPLLAAAPWIMVRGNHEMCNRSGQGWYRFLDTNAFDATDHHTCDNPADDSTAAGGSFNTPYLVNINSSTQIVVFDTSNGKPVSGTSTSSGSVWYTTYANEMTAAGNLVASPLAFNLWANHHPIFGYSTATAPTLPTDSIPLFTGVMGSVFPSTYFPPPINLALHGHTHDYQALNFAPGTLSVGGGTFQPAATLVSGNAGDLLDTALPYPLTGSAVSPVLNPTAVSVATVGGVQEFATSDNGTPYQNPNSSTDSDFGYMVLQFNAGPPATWVSTEYRADNTVRDVCTIQTSGQMSCTSWGTVLQDDAGVY
jgi:hypothetical protein